MGRISSKFAFLKFFLCFSIAIATTPCKGDDIAFLNDSTSNPNWMRVARQFSEATLRAHPDTDTVMSFFSDEATFTEFGQYENVGKTVAWFAFKVLYEWQILQYEHIEEPKFEKMNGRIVWIVNSRQLRKGILPTWIKEPEWWYVGKAVHLYFTGNGNHCKISKCVTTASECELIEKKDN